jgi:hypothetical protein
LKGQLEALGSEALGQQVLEYKVAQEALELEFKDQLEVLE